MATTARSSRAHGHATALRASHRHIQACSIALKLASDRARQAVDTRDQQQSPLMMKSSTVRRLGYLELRPWRRDMPQKLKVWANEPAASNLWGVLLGDDMMK